MDLREDLLRGIYSYGFEAPSVSDRLCLTLLHYNENIYQCAKILTCSSSIL